MDNSSCGGMSEHVEFKMGLSREFFIGPARLGLLILYECIFASMWAEKLAHSLPVNDVSEKSGLLLFVIFLLALRLMS